MKKPKLINEEILTVHEFLDYGIQLNTDSEFAVGTFKNKKGERVFIKPVDWIIDKENIIMFDIQQSNSKVH